MSDKRNLTVRLQFTGTDEEWLALWVWDSHKRYVLEGAKTSPTHDVVVTGVFDDDLIKKNRELEEKLAKYEEEFGSLDEGESDENDVS